MMTRKILISLIITACSVTACASAEETGLHLSTDETPVGFSPVISPQVPTEITFAGDKVKFDRADMFERLDRELTSVAYTHGTTLLMLKRANKYFPVMAPILKKNGIPIDFLYLACVESSLNPRALSPAKAAGFWQFIPSTAKEFGLEVNDYVDERYNIEKATDAAARYLKSGYRRYGNWESVAASYNGGMARISRELESQMQNSAFDLYLTEETSRYMFRIFAMKLIMENPEAFGYKISPEQLYHPVKTTSIEVNTPIENLPLWAVEHGTSYQWLRELNPWLRSKSLPNKTGKTYRILIPENDKALHRSQSDGKTFNIKEF